MNGILDNKSIIHLLRLVICLVIMHIFCWYRPITRKYVDYNSSKLDIMIESHLVLLKLLLVCSPGHMHVVDVLKAVDELDRVIVANGQANNGRETKSVATASPSTSATLVIRGRGRCVIASPSPSTTPIIRSCGRRAATPRVVTSLEIPAPISHASPLPKVLPPAHSRSPVLTLVLNSI